MIYIVEDDASIRELEQYALQSNGYEVQGFESAEPFWQAMRAAEPELVILDVMLPGEDGFSILKKLRNTPSPVSYTHLCSQKQSGRPYSDRKSRQGRWSHR